MRFRYGCYIFLSALLLSCQAQKVEKLEERTGSLLLQLETLEHGFQDLHDSLTKIKSVEQDFEQSTKNQKRTIADFGVLVESFKNDLALVQGKLEEHSYLLAELKKDFEKTKKDFDFRLNELEKGRPAAKEKVKSERVDDDSEMMLYQKALSEFQQGRYESAISLLSAFIDEYPKSPMAGNAAFLLGKGYFNQEKWPEAISNFQNVVDRYPKSTKRCEAVFLQGQAFEKLKQDNVAVIAFEDVVKNCEGEEVQPKAEAQLAALKKRHEDNTKVAPHKADSTVRKPQSNAISKPKAPSPIKKHPK